MNPYFSEMKKREKSNENHKASIRKKTKRNKKLYFGQNENAKNKDYDFPKMTGKQFQEFKLKLERERKVEKVKTGLIIIVVFVIAIITMIYTRKLY